MIYRFSLGENQFPKMFEKYKRNIKTGTIDPETIIKTQDLNYTYFYEKEKTLNNIMMFVDNIKIMSTCLNSGGKKIRSKENFNVTKGRKNSQQNFTRKSTLRKGERKKSTAKLNLRGSYDKESPTFISEDNSEYNDSPSLSPQKSRVSIFIKKKISNEK